MTFTRSSPYSSPSKILKMMSNPLLPVIHNCYALFLKLNTRYESFVILCYCIMFSSYYVFFFGNLLVPAIMSACLNMDVFGYLYECSCSRQRCTRLYLASIKDSRWRLAHHLNHFSLYKIILICIICYLIHTHVKLCRTKALSNIKNLFTNFLLYQILSRKDTIEKVLLSSSVILFIFLRPMFNMFPARNWPPKYPLLCLFMWIHMKGTILALSFNQLPIYGQEEVLPLDKII